MDPQGKWLWVQISLLGLSFVSKREREFVPSGELVPQIGVEAIGSFVVITCTNSAVLSSRER